MTSSSKRRAVATLFSLVSVLVLSGCGYIMGGSTKSISVQSTPSGPMITTQPRSGQFTTPVTLVFKRKHAYTLIARKDGYHESNFRIRKVMRIGPLFFDLMLAGLVAPIVVDAVTGGWWDLQPEHASITLFKADDSVEGPDVIEVTISAGELSSSGVLGISSTEPVFIEVVKK